MFLFYSVSPSRSVYAHIFCVPFLSFAALSVLLFTVKTESPTRSISTAKSNLRPFVVSNSVLISTL